MTIFWFLMAALVLGGLLASLWYQEIKTRDLVFVTSGCRRGAPDSRPTDRLLKSAQYLLACEHGCRTRARLDVPGRDRPERRGAGVIPCAPPVLLALVPWPTCCLPSERPGSLTVAVIHAPSPVGIVPRLPVFVLVLFPQKHAGPL